MAVDKSVLLSSIEQYQQSNERPMAKNTIIAKHGEDAVAVLKELVTEGKVACRRGRNGGFYPTNGATVQTEAPAQEVAAEGVDDDIAAQFAALNAKLAADEAAQEQSEQQAWH